HVLLGACALRSHAALPRLERNQLGAMDGRHSPPLRCRTSSPRHVSSAQILYERELKSRESTCRRRGGACRVRSLGPGCWSTNDSNGRSARRETIRAATLDACW